MWTTSLMLRSQDKGSTTSQRRLVIEASLSMRGIKLFCTVTAKGTLAIRRGTSNEIVLRPHDRHIRCASAISFFEGCHIAFAKQRTMSCCQVLHDAQLRLATTSTGEALMQHVGPPTAGVHVSHCRIIHLAMWDIGNWTGTS